MMYYFIWIARAGIQYEAFAAHRYYRQLDGFTQQQPYLINAKFETQGITCILLYCITHLVWINQFTPLL